MQIDCPNCGGKVAVNGGVIADHPESAGFGFNAGPAVQCKAGGTKYDGPAPVPVLTLPMPCFVNTAVCPECGETVELSDGVIQDHPVKRFGFNAGPSVQCSAGGQRLEIAIMRIEPLDS